MKNTDLLRPLLLQKIFSTELLKNNPDFKSWIASGKFVVRSIDSSSSFHLEVNDEFSFHNMIVYDSCRMAAASFETMFNIQPAATLPKSFGWLAIKSYYAAFFSAHSIMRCFGYTCSQLEKGHATQLNQFGAAIDVPGELRTEAGYFSGSYNSETRIHSLKKMKNTHEDTWKTLVSCLTNISRDILSVTGLTAHKQGLSADIDELIDRLTDKGRLPKGNRLSVFRNSVNYRQDHHSWHPYGKKSVCPSKISTLLGTWNDLDAPEAPEWKESIEAYKFFLTCRDLVNLNYLLVKLILANMENKKNLYSQWPLRLIEQAGDTS